MEMVKMSERLIDAEILLHVLSKYTEYSDDDEQEINADLVFGEIQEAPTVDAVRVVRCKDCLKRGTSMCHAGHEQADMDYCSHGAKMDEEDDHVR